jgi:hypothetical protein
MAILTSYEGSNDDYQNQGTSAVVAQSFKLPNAATVTHVSIYGSRGNSASGTFKIELVSGSYAGTVIATTGTLTTTSSLTAYGSPQWNELALSSSVALDAATSYWMKVTAISGSANDEVRWSTDTTSPSYADGAQWINGTEYTGRDSNFRISGSVGTPSTGNFFLLF